MTRFAIDCRGVAERIGVIIGKQNDWKFRTRFLLISRATASVAFWTGSAFVTAALFCFRSRPAAPARPAKTRTDFRSAKNHSAQFFPKILSFASTNSKTR